MNPFNPPKKDIAMCMTTNIYMNTTTKYVPTPGVASQKQSPQKVKEQSFVYRPPQKNNKDSMDKKEPTEMKRSSISRSSGIEISKVSELGSSSLFKGLDGLYTKPIQHTDRSKQAQSQQKQQNGNISSRDESNSNQNRFGRRQANNLADNSISSNQYNTAPKNITKQNQQEKQEKADFSSSQIIIRKPLGRRSDQVQQKVKEVQKSPVITRTNQRQEKPNTQKEESFTTQTSSYVYKVPIRRTTVTSQTAHEDNTYKKQSLPINTKDEVSKKIEPKVPTPIQPNIYARNRSRESKEVNLNLQINTDVNVFKIGIKGGDSKRSSVQKPTTAQKSVETKAITQKQIMNTQPIQVTKDNTLAKVQSPKKKQQQKKTEKEVPYYRIPQKKVQPHQQIQPEAKKQDPKPIIEKKSPVKVENINKNQPTESKPYVYTPRTIQNSGNLPIKTNNIQSKPDQIQAKPVNTYNNQKTTPNQYGKINQVKNTTIQTQNPVVKVQPSKTYPYSTRQNNLQKDNQPSSQNQNQKADETEQVTSNAKPSSQYNPRKQNYPHVSENTTKAKSPQVQKQPQVSRYPYNRKPILTQQEPQVIQKEAPQSPKGKQTPKYQQNFGGLQTKLAHQEAQIAPSTKRQQQTQPPKVNTSGYVYQPPSKKGLNQTTTNQKSNVSSSKDISIIQNISTNVTNVKNETSKPTPIYQRKSNEIKETVNVVNPPKSYSSNKQVQSNQNSTKTIEHPTQTSNKKHIPNSALSILNILIKKKLKSNLKHSLSQIFRQAKKKGNSEKHFNLFILKSFGLFENYQNYLKTEAFTQLKRQFISLLTSGSQNVSGSRIIGVKPMSKTKQLKEDLELQNLSNSSRRPLCHKLNSLFNSKVRLVFQQKLVKYYGKQNYIAQKQPLFQSMFRIFSLKTSQNLSISLKKLKFHFSYVSFKNDEDVLPLFERKNKKLSKQEISKYFQSIFQTAPIKTDGSRVSLLDKTPEKKFQAKQQISRTPSIKSIESPKQSQKIVSLRTRIQNLSKQINQQQKIVNDKEKQINSRKLELKKQMNTLKKDNEIRKKENLQLKEKLKNYESYNFGDSKDNVILGSEIQMESVSRKQGTNSNQNILNAQNNEFLNILCDVYVENILKGHAPKHNQSDIDNFMRICSQSGPLLKETMNLLINPQDESGYKTIKNDQELMLKLMKTKQLITQKLLVEQNLLLKVQISGIEAQFCGQSQQVPSQTSIKIQEQVDTMKSLVKNYIKERYLWQWIRKSIDKY